MANTSFKTENGLLVIGDSFLTGNVTVANSYSLTANTIVPANGSSLLGNNTLRWALSGSTGNFSGTLAVSGNLAVNTSVLTAVSNTIFAGVGVGTSTPDAPLAVVGAANVSGAVRFANTLTVVGTTTIGAGPSLLVNTTLGLVRINTTDVTNTSNIFVVSGNTQVTGNQIVTGKITAGSVKVDGDLQVSGNLAYTGTSTGDIIPNGNTYSLGSALDANNRWSLYGVTGSFDSDFAVGGKFSVANTTTTHTIAGNTSFDSGVLFVDSVNNRVGINNIAPTQALSVTGQATISGAVVLSNNASIGGTLIVSGVGPHLISGNVNIDSGALFVDSVNNRVGVNSFTPDASLSVVGTANVSGAVTMGNTLTVTSNVHVGNTTSYVDIKPDGALRVSKEVEIGNTGLYANLATMTVASTNTLIDAFPTAEYSTAKYVVNYKSTSNTQIFGVTEFLVMHNGGVVIMTEYASVFSANILKTDFY